MINKQSTDPLANTKRMLQNDRYKDISKLKSVYLWGDPGCGKTFIMEQFYESLGQEVTKKKLHYNEFMLEVHKEEHKLNQKLKNQKEKDTITTVGNSFCKELTVFCVDEF